MYQITHNSVQYTQLPGNEIYVKVQIQTNHQIGPNSFISREEDITFEKVNRTMWTGLLDFIEDRTGDDLSLTAEGLAQKFSPESSMHLPFMLIGDRLVKFTSLFFTDKSSGDDTFVMVDQKGHYHLFNSSYEPDSDGAFYSNGYIDSLKGILSDYTIEESASWNAMLLFNVLNRIQ